MDRRSFLTTGIGVGLSGCVNLDDSSTPQNESSRLLTETPNPDIETSTTEVGSPSSYGFYDGKPYEGVDWDTYGRHKGQFHVHPHYGDLGPPQDVYDLYVELGYDVICLQPKDELKRGMPWPLDEMGEYHDEWENRYPAEDGVVAIPGVEYTDTQHITGFFTDLMQEELIDVLGSGSNENPQHQYDTVEQILISESIPDSVSPVAFIGHPGRYKAEMPAAEWEEKWVENYHKMVKDFDRLLGLEVISYSFGYDDRDTWDRLLREAAPDRPVIGTSVDDIGEPDDADRGWVTFYLSPEEFDPSDQQATQEHIYEAWTAGRTSFSTTAEPRDEAPIIESIERDDDAGTITIQARGYDVIEWVSDGEVIATGETIEYGDNSDLGTYLRVQLVRGESPDYDAVTCTQAWY